MSSAERFLKRQKQAARPVSTPVQSSLPAKDVPNRGPVPASPSPKVAERPAPIFTSADALLPKEPRRKWPGVVGGVVGALLLLGVVGQLNDSTDGDHASTQSNASGTTLTEKAALVDRKDELERYFGVDQGKVSYWYRQTLISPFVADNNQYVDIACTVEPVFKSDDPTVNAFATIVEHKGKSVRIICVYGGLVWFSRVAALAASAQIVRGDDSFVRFLRSLQPEDFGKMDSGRALQLVQQTGIATAEDADDILVRAREISDGMLMGVMAHELGHHVFGHVSAERKKGLRVSRIQEDQADSFASCFIEESSSRQSLLMGTLIWYYALSQMELANNVIATDHPASHERYKNFIKRHANVAHSLGFIE